MLLRAFVEPQLGATYGDQLAFALTAERLGFDAFFRSDHFHHTNTKPPGPTDAWTTLAGLARETSTIRLGTMVTPVTFRLPGVLAVQVAQVDEMSGGRVELGLGAGWNAREHEAYGVPFPARRFDLLEEQLEIITGMWSATGPFTFHGEHYDVVDSPALPKPVQRPMPVIVGGKGQTRVPALAARFATEFNHPVPASLDDVAPAFARVDAACVAIGRDPKTLRHTLVQTIRDVPDMRERMLRVAEDGVEALYIQFLDLHDLALLERTGEELLPLAASL